MDSKTGETSEAAPANERELMGVTVDRLNEAIARGKQVLFDAREQRIKPFRDEKMLTAWNGLMISAFARGICRIGISRASLIL